MRAQKSFAWLLLLPLASCLEMELEQRSQPIVGGQTTTEYPAVPQLTLVTGNEAGACSGTLISPRVILTAAHCLDLGGEPTQQYAYFGTTTNGGETAFVERIDIVDSIFPSQWSLSAHDIGMVLLEHDSVVEPMDINRTPLGAGDIGRSLHLVGWGDTDGGAGDAGDKREVTASILGYQNDFVLAYGTFSANTCQGDSGGPGFISVGGEEVVATITSFGTGGCRGESGGTRVAQYTDYIDEWVAENDPVLPPTLSVKSPQEGDVVQSGFSVHAEAEDNTRVERVELLLDGSLVATLTLSPYIANTPAVSDGQHQLEVRAYDNRGDTATETMTITVDSSCQKSDDCLGDLLCEDGVCVDPPDGGELGSPCTGNDDCDSGSCGMGADGSYCTRACDPEDSASCPDGFRCASAGDSGGVCWPQESSGGGGCAAGGSGSQAPLPILLAALAAFALIRRRR